MSATFRRALTAAALAAAAATEASAQESASAPLSDKVYQRYATPAACLAAVSRVDREVEWDRRTDTLAADRTRTLPAAAVDVARRCAGRFLPPDGQAASVAAKDLDAVFRLALVVGDDSLAAAVLRRIVATQDVLEDSTDVLASGLAAYLSIRPARLVAGQATAAQLDSLGFLGDGLETPFWTSHHSYVLRAAQSAFDSIAMVGAARGLFANAAALPKARQQGYAFESAVISSVTADALWALRTQHPDTVIARMKARAATLLGPDAFAGTMAGSALALVGKPVPPMEPDFWFNRGLTDSTLPRPGHVTLIQHVGAGCTWCTYGVLRRLKARFGDSLDIILLANTNGRFRDQLQLEPAREAELIRERLLTEHGLVAKLAVWVTKFDRLPDPDRRLRAQPIPGLQRFYYGSGPLLVDRRGVAILSAPMGVSEPGSEGFLTHAIESLLRW